MPSVLQSMSPRGRIALGASVVGVLVVAFMLMKLASAPSYTTLSAGIDPSQTGKITGALDGAGVAYKIGNGGASVPGKQGGPSPARGPPPPQGQAGRPLPGSRRARLQGPEQQRVQPARLRAARQAEARRQQLPAAGR